MRELSDIRFKEGFSWKVVIFNSILYPLIIGGFIFFIVTISDLINGRIHGIYFFEVFIFFLQFYLIIGLPAGIITSLLNSIFQQKGYGMTDGAIYVASSKSLPLTGRVFFIKDIKSIKLMRMNPTLYIFKKSLRRYANNLTYCPLQHEIYLIDLKENYKIVNKKMITDPPKSNNFFLRYLYRTWYGPYITVPKHIIDTYIDEYNSFPTELIRRN